MAKKVTVSERRRRQRQPVKNGALAVTDRNAGQILFGQIVDVSLDGLCFNYIESVHQREEGHADRQDRENETLDIVLSSHNFTLTDLPVLTVSDHETVPPQPYGPAGRWRCRCVQFGKMTQDQVANLKQFIQINGESRCAPTDL